MARTMKIDSMRTLSLEEVEPGRYVGIGANGVKTTVIARSQVTKSLRRRTQLSVEAPLRTYDAAGLRTPANDSLITGSFVLDHAEGLSFEALSGSIVPSDAVVAGNGYAREVLAQVIMDLVCLLTDSFGPSIGSAADMKTRADVLLNAATLNHPLVRAAIGLPVLVDGQTYGDSNRLLAGQM